MQHTRLTLTLAAALLTLPLAAQDLPSGPGKAVFQRMCSTCHGLEGIVRAKMNKDRWTTVVDDMVARGAQGSDEDIEKVITYLTTNFSAKLNINKAVAGDLTALGLTPDEAQAIIRYRVEKGTVKDLDDLAKVPNLPAAKVASLKDRVEF